MIFPVEHHRQVSFEGSTLSLPIYLDYPAMVTAVKESSGNPHSSTHHFGHQARHSIEQAQAHIAKLIHARPHEIIFTSGATEANNLALLGFVRAASGARHVISVETEHEAVLQPLKYLSKHEGIALTLMQVDENGLIDLKDLETMKRVCDRISAPSAVSVLRGISPFTVMLHKRSSQKDWTLLRMASRCSACPGIRYMAQWASVPSI